MLENHPFNAREPIPKQTSVLIVGTAPPPRFSSPRTGENRRRLDFDFFYGSEDNDMWPILEEVAEERDGLKLFQDDYSSDQCCLVVRSFLERHCLWMRDVLNTYERKLGKATSAIDTDIVAPKPENLTDFRTIFASCPSLKTIAFTSQQAARWTFNALLQQELMRAFSFSKALMGWKNSLSGVRYARPLLTISIGQIPVSFFILPSPSSRSPEPYEAKKQVYRAVLFEIPNS